MPKQSSNHSEWRILLQIFVSFIVHPNGSTSVLFVSVLPVLSKVCCTPVMLVQHMSHASILPCICDMILRILAHCGFKNGEEFIRKHVWWNDIQYSIGDFC